MRPITTAAWIFTVWRNRSAQCGPVEVGFDEFAEVQGSFSCNEFVPFRWAWMAGLCHKERHKKRAVIELITGDPGLFAPEMTNVAPQARHREDWEVTV